MTLIQFHFLTSAFTLSSSFSAQGGGCRIVLPIFPSLSMKNFHCVRPFVRTHIISI
jgi:hypothetical protein